MCLILLDPGIRRDDENGVNQRFLRAYARSGEFKKNCGLQGCRPNRIRHTAFIKKNSLSPHLHPAPFSVVSHKIVVISEIPSILDSGCIQQNFEAVKVCLASITLSGFATIMMAG